jgi:group I intron endonuclease
MNSKSAGIYSITSKVNGKRYVGSSIRICKRWKEHLNKLRANKHHSPMLQNHYNKYGEQDLYLSVLEVVERGGLSLEAFKQLLLDQEQTYLNNWDSCQFNCLPTAGSTLNYKFKGAKYYSYSSYHNLYKITYKIGGVTKSFGSCYTEEEAKTEVEYIKSLTEQQLIEYQLECSARPIKQDRRIGLKRGGAKYYHFDKKANKYVVTYNVLGKHLQFSCHITEEEAIKEVEYLRTLTDDELLKYKKECVAKPKCRPRNAKFYSWDKKSNKYSVQFKINGIKKHYGYFATEQEAIDKVKELKQELDIKQGF